jgi:hypothetical protein
VTVLLTKPVKVQALNCVNDDSFAVFDVIEAGKQSDNDERRMKCNATQW